MWQFLRKYSVVLFKAFSKKMYLADPLLREFKGYTLNWYNKAQIHIRIRHSLVGSVLPYLMWGQGLNPRSDIFNKNGIRRNISPRTAS